MTADDPTDVDPPPWRFDTTIRERPNTLGTKVSPAELTVEERHDVLIAHQAIERGFVEIGPVNQALDLRSRTEDAELGQILHRRGALSSGSLVELLREVRLLQSESIEEVLARPPHLAVHRRGKQLVLVDEGHPERLGPYRVLEKIASGGMGTIYRAFHPDLDRLVALKVFRPAAGEDPEEVARFRREARMAARLEHPAIVRVWDVGRDRGVEYIAMDYVEGGDLAGHLKTSTPPIEDRLRLLAAVARAVGHAHAQGIIHRDLKPSNVLMGPDGAPVVTDFGLARPISGGEDLTRTSTVLGTPRYMAPEQVRGQSDVGPPADVYALGAVLFEVLTGRPMNPGRDVMSIFHWTLSTVPSPIVLDGQRVDPEIEAIFQKAVEKDADRRYPDAGALAAEIDRHLAGQPIETRLPGISRRFVQALPTWLRKAERSALLAALLCLMPWAVYRLTETYPVIRPVVALQIFCDLVAVVVGGLVYLALKQRRTLEEERVPLLRQLDHAHKRLALLRERAMEERRTLLGEPMSRTLGCLELATAAEAEPAMPAVARASLELGGGRVAFLLVGAVRPAGAPALVVPAAVRGRFEATTDIADVGALADHLADAAGDGEEAIVVAVVDGAGTVEFARRGKGPRPVLVRSGGARQFQTDGRIEIERGGTLHLLAGGATDPEKIISAIAGTEAQRPIAFSTRVRKALDTIRLNNDWVGLVVHRPR